MKQKIEIQGEREYREALRQIQRELRLTNSELDVAKTAFDKTEKSEQDIIKVTGQYEKAINSQENAISKLDGYIAKMNEQYAKNGKEIDSLNKQKAEELKKLKEIEQTYSKSSDQYKQQSEKVDDLDKQIQKLNKEQDKLSQSTTQARTESNKIQTSLNKTTKEMDSLGSKTEQTNSKFLSISNDGFTVFKGVLADLASNAIQKALSAVSALGKGIVNLGKQSLQNFANYEQLAGGVETLFGKSADIVKEYANNAYKTSGLGANQYLETVTSFSASLLQSLGGDTKEAAEISDMAIVDMSDNANKMGTSMESITDAYKGFAKQNYTMLDNLKLGYGGTKTEMERLLKDAEKLSGQKYDIKNLNDVYQAIHVIQQEMGITGTTAVEAEKTISGSMNATKSAWQNLLTGLASGADLTGLTQNLIQSILNLTENLTPAIGQMISSLKTMLDQGLVNGVFLELIQTIVPLIKSWLPEIASVVLQITEAIIDVVEELIPVIIKILITEFPRLVDLGMKIILSLYNGIMEALPGLLQYLPEIIIKAVGALLQNLPLFWQAGINLDKALIQGILSFAGSIINEVSKIGSNIINTIGNSLSGAFEIGKNFVLGIWEGLKSSLEWLKRQIQGWVGNIMDFIKKLFGIASPSKVFKEQIGKNLALGLGAGFTQEMGAVKKEMENAIPDTKELIPAYENNYPLVQKEELSNDFSMEKLINAFSIALEGVEVVMDDENMGKFVRKTVEKAIFA